MNDIDKIRSREALATKGPWKSTYASNGAGMATGYFYIPAHNGGGKVEMLADDAEFCAKAREDIPFLLAKLDRLTAAAREIVEARAEQLKSARFPDPGDFHAVCAAIDALAAILEEP